MIRRKFYAGLIAAAMLALIGSQLQPSVVLTTAGPDVNLVQAVLAWNDEWVCNKHTGVSRLATEVFKDEKSWQKALKEGKEWVSGRDCKPIEKPYEKKTPTPTVTSTPVVTPPATPAPTVPPTPATTPGVPTLFQLPVPTPTLVPPPPPAAPPVSDTPPSGGGSATSNEVVCLRTTSLNETTGVTTIHTVAKNTTDANYMVTQPGYFRPASEGLGEDCGITDQYIYPPKPTPTATPVPPRAAPAPAPQVVEAPPVVEEVAPPAPAPQPCWEMTDEGEVAYKEDGTPTEVSCNPVTVEVPEVPYEEITVPPNTGDGGNADTLVP